MAKGCEKCGEALDLLRSGRVPRYCSTRCRVAAHRARQIPQEMRRENRWVSWRENKAPVQMNGRPASSTDPRTWTSWPAVQPAARRGFVLGGGIGCIDLDHCLVDGEPTTEAAALLKRLPPTYIEISPGGDGLHIWGRLPEGRGTRRKANGLSVEVYSVGRYMTVTSRPFAGSVSRLADLSGLDLI